MCAHQACFGIIDTAVSDYIRKIKIRTRRAKEESTCPLGKSTNLALRAAANSEIRKNMHKQILENINFGIKVCVDPKMDDELPGTSRKSQTEMMKKLAGSPMELRDNMKKHLSKEIIGNRVNMITTTTTTSTMTFTTSSCQSSFSVATSHSGNICTTKTTSSADATLATPNVKSPTTKICSYQGKSVPSWTKVNKPEKISKIIQKSKKTYINPASKGRSSALEDKPRNTLHNNRYAALATEAEMAMEMDEIDDQETEERETEESNKKTHKPPAICVPNVMNMAKMEKELNQVVKPDQYSIRTSKAGISRIYAENPNTFRAVVKLLTEQNCEFWHHQLRENKPYRLVVKDIHPNVPMEVIQQTFTEKGFTVLNIYCPRKPGWQNITHNIEEDEEEKEIKTRQNMFYVNIESTPNAAEALQISQIGRHRVTVTKARASKELVQCYRCQGFGHTRNYCLKKPICGKCAGEHETKSNLCNLNINDKCFCANCGEEHMASYKGCKVRVDLTKKLKPPARLPVNGLPSNSSNYQRQGPTAEFISQAAVKSGITYADMVRPRRVEHQRQINQGQTWSAAAEDNTKFTSIEKAIRDLNNRMDQVFKFMEETRETNRLLRVLVDKLI